MQDTPLTVLTVMANASLRSFRGRLGLATARGLVRRGHTVMLASRPDLELAAACAEVGVAHLALPMPHGLDPGSVGRLARLVRGQAVDVVHAHGAVAHSVATGGVLLGGPCALLVDRESSFRPSWPLRLAWASRRVRRVIADCDAVRRVLLASSRLDPGKVAVVPPAADPAVFDASRVEPGIARRHLAVPPAARLVGLFGMRAWQGWKELLQAVAMARHEIGDIHLVLAGCTSRRQVAAVLQVAAETGLAGAVTAVRSDHDPAGLLAACDVVVDASWAGTSVGAALLPAMALGRPVAATALAGNVELVADGESGILVPPRDTATLAAAVARLLRDGELAARLAAAGHERAVGPFSLERRLDAVEAVYRAAAAGDDNGAVTPADT
ncbi:MAG: glycosyltransferase family 4 protein [Acidobacteria bacterium]|nr:glycosyltransferase family 4 protein [Acidobacteriota bacterium]